MGRPRAYATDEVVRAARELFWERGYEATSLADLEERTGLNRSSLYAAFGSKRALFDEALRCYLDEVVEPRMAGLEGEGAGLAEVVAYLRALAGALRADHALSSRGCLLVNTIAELAARDPAARDSGRRYRDRIDGALRHALAGAAARGELDPGVVEACARTLTATVIGILLTARLDPADAADVADTVADLVAGELAGPGRP